MDWVKESWIVVIIGFLFIGILLDAVIASREALAGFIKRLRKKQAESQDSTKGR